MGKGGGATVGAPRSMAAILLCLALGLMVTACVDGDPDQAATATTSATTSATDPDAATTTRDAEPAAPTDGASNPADEAVTISADGIELSGTLRLPEAAGPHTAFVIAHGSGPQSRQGMSPGQLGLTLPRQVPVYEELAEAFRDDGHAVLTFDKRTCGPFNGCADNDYPTPPDDLTLEAFVDDVAAALDHLAARDDIGELVLLGHSQGGTIAAQLAADRDDLAAVVLLATPAVPIEDVLAAQADTLERLVESAGQGGQQADRAVGELQDLADAVTAVAAGEVEGGSVGGVSREFWSSWIEASRSSPDQIRDADLPVLVVGGQNDWNVLPSQVQAWEPHLGPDDALQVLPGITHALTHLATDDPAAITASDVGTSVHDSVIDTVGEWLRATLGP